MTFGLVQFARVEVYRKNPKQKIRQPEKFAVINLNFEQSGFTIEQCVQKMPIERQTV